MQRILGSLWLVCALAFPAAGNAAQSLALSKKQATLAARPDRTGSVDCAAAFELTCGAIHDSTNAGLPDEASSYGCADYAETGGEVVYRFTLSVPTQVTLELNGLSGDLDLFLLAGCDAADCIAVSAGVSDELIVRCLNPGTYVVVVDGYEGGSSDFTLEFTCGPCGPCGPDAPGDVCGYAAHVPGHISPYFVTGNTKCAQDDYHDSGCTGYSSLGRDLAYRIVMPPGCTMQAFLRDGPDGVVLDRSLYLIESCNDPAGTCVAGSDLGIEIEESITYQSIAGGIYYLIVDAFGLDVGGDFELEIRQTNCSVVRVETRNWQDVKRIYR